MNVTVTNHFGAISAAAEKQLQKAVRKAALDIEREAKIAAPVDTGFLRASIHTVTGLEQGMAADIPVGAEYGIYVEYGTHRNRAQPFLTPAVEKVRPGFEKAVSEALEGK
jgi:HK97 gp10 family phage protein